MSARNPETPFGGDAPCSDCGTPDNIVWFTESVFWNAVCRSDPDYDEPILCIPCFVLRAQRKGYRPRGWRLLPEWPWANIDEGAPYGKPTADAPEWMSELAGSSTVEQGPYKPEAAGSTPAQPTNPEATP